MHDLIIIHLYQNQAQIQVQRKILPIINKRRNQMKTVHQRKSNYKIWQSGRIGHIATSFINDLCGYLIMFIFLICCAQTPRYLSMQRIQPTVVRPETGSRDQEFNPGSTKSLCCEVRGSKPGPVKHHANEEHKKFTECTHKFHVEHVCWMTNYGQTNELWPD